MKLEDEIYRHSLKKLICKEISDNIYTTINFKFINRNRIREVYKEGSHRRSVEYFDFNISGYSDNVRSLLKKYYEFTR